MTSRLEGHDETFLGFVVIIVSIVVFVQTPFARPAVDPRPPT
jgi:hypothetical protein